MLQEFQCIHKSQNHPPSQGIIGKPYVYFCIMSPWNNSMTKFQIVALRDKEGLTIDPPIHVLESPCNVHVALLNDYILSTIVSEYLFCMLELFQ